MQWANLAGAPQLHWPTIFTAWLGALTFSFCNEPFPYCHREVAWTGSRVGWLTHVLVIQPPSPPRGSEMGQEGRHRGSSAARCFATESIPITRQSSAASIAMGPIAKTLEICTPPSSVALAECFS